ncbi:MAG: hypothetical protein HYX29_10690 [Solirubrobacterales bacterium]|nr:hypothetical protein [Solirubrobacterales bacterium]
MKKLLVISLLAAFAAILPAAGASAAEPAQQRVIAQLNLAEGAAPEQITATTDALLRALPNGSFSVNNRYSTLPYVALSAGPLALSVLQQSDLVVAIYRDWVVTAASQRTKKCNGAKKKKKKTKKTCKTKSPTKKKVS